MAFSNAKEIQTITEVDPDSGIEKKIQVSRAFEVLYVRGDSIILLSPLVRT